MDRFFAPQERAVRTRSASLFGGAQYRLEVCGALQSGETVSAAGLMDRLPRPPMKASVHMEIQRLVASGLLMRLEKRAGDRHAYLKVASTGLWQAAREIAAAARETADLQTTPERLPGLYGTST